MPEDGARMSVRAILLGLFCGAVVCGFGYFNDAVLRQTHLVGNHLPISVYGGLILFLLLVNPVLFKIGKRLALTGKELAVILTLTLTVCCIPGSGLRRSFTPALMLPHPFARSVPGWKPGKALLLQRTLGTLQTETWATSPAFDVVPGTWYVQYAWKARLHSPEHITPASVVRWS